MTRPSTSEGLGPRTWRAAVVTFLVVFLGGLGVSGASALWSQTATATAGITTGYWKSNGPGWKMPLDVSVISQSSSLELFEVRHDVHLGWEPTSVDDRRVDGVAYTVAITELRGGDVREVGPVRVQGDQGTVTVVVDRNWLGTASFRLTITPRIGDVAGEPTVRTLTVRSSGATLGP